MSRVNLCLGQYARTPYTFEKARTRVFCVEELCYFLKENAWLLDEAVLGKGLADWPAGIGRQIPGYGEGKSEGGGTGDPDPGLYGVL